MDVDIFRLLVRPQGEAARLLSPNELRLRDAYLCGDREEAMRLIAHGGIDPTVVPLLFTAARVGDVEVVCALMSRQAEVEAGGGADKSVSVAWLSEALRAVINASPEASVDVAQRLLDAGARADEDALYWAANRGHAQLCELLVHRAGLDVRWGRPDTGRNALYWPVAFAHLPTDRLAKYRQVIETLIHLGVPVRTRDLGGRTLLHVCTNPEIWDLLVQNGAESSADGQGKWPVRPDTDRKLRERERYGSLGPGQSLGDGAMVGALVGTGAGQLVFAPTDLAAGAHRAIEAHVVDFGAPGTYSVWKGRGWVGVAVANVTIPDSEGSLAHSVGTVTTPTGRLVIGGAENVHYFPKGRQPTGPDAHRYGERLPGVPSVWRVKIGGREAEETVRRMDNASQGKMFFDPTPRGDAFLSPPFADVEQAKEMIALLQRQGIALRCQLHDDALVYDLLMESPDGEYDCLLGRGYKLACSSSGVTPLIVSRRPDGLCQYARAILSRRDIQGHLTREEDEVLRHAERASPQQQV